MLYVASITTLANTPASAPLSSTLHVTSGLIVDVEFFFPPGSAGLLYMQLLDSTYQMYPTTLGEALRGDNTLMKYPEMYMKTEPPYSLTVKTWNLDTVYDHWAQVRISMVSKEEFMARYLPSMQTEAIDAIMAKVSLQQTETKAAQMEALRSRFAFFGG